MKTVMKQTVYRVYGLLSSIKYPKELFLSFRYMFDEKRVSNKECVELSADWLLKIQNSDGGYSRKFSLIKGRDKS